jgi:hypothetical protein
VLVGVAHVERKGQAWSMPIILHHQCQLNLTTDTGLPFCSSLLF